MPAVKTTALRKSLETRLERSNPGSLKISVPSEKPLTRLMPSIISMPVEEVSSLVSLSLLVELNITIFAMIQKNGLKRKPLELLPLVKCHI